MDRFAALDDHSRESSLETFTPFVLYFQFGQFVFYFNVIYYCVFIGLFTSFMLLSIKPHDPMELADASSNPKYDKVHNK